MSQYITAIHEENSPSAELQQVAKSLHHLFPGWKFHLHGELDSTNSEARRLGLRIGGDAWPRVILADHQTAGRGSNNRTWEAPPHKGLLATLMFPKTLLKVPQSLLPWAVGCWCLEGLERNGIREPKLKWPNDLLAKGQKVGGILCETIGAAYVIGVGVNLEQSEFELPRRAPGVPQPTSIRQELGEMYPGRTPAMFSLLTSLMESLENPGSPAQILRISRQRCSTLGLTVSFNDPILGSIAGEAVRIDDDGGLVVDVPTHGERKAWIPFQGESA